MRNDIKTRTKTGGSIGPGPGQAISCGSEPSSGEKEYTDPSFNLSTAVVTLGELIDTVRADVASLEATIRSHMPNHLYDDKDCESKESEGFSTASQSSPLHAAIVEDLNRLLSISRYIQHVRLHVVT
jgi:hypothetical protein